MKQKKKMQAGFSLIELLFAVLFLTVIVFGVLRLQTSHLTIGNTQQNQLRAHFYTTQALEIATALGLGTMKSCGEICYLAGNNQNYALSNTPELLEEGLFERSLSISSDDLVNAFLVTAKVRWEDSAGVHEVSGMRVISE